MESSPEERPRSRTSPVVDWDAATRMLPDSLCAKIAKDVPPENRRLLAEARRALEAGSASDLAFALHGLKNNVLYFLRDEFAAPFLEAERAARRGELDFVRDRIDALASVLEDLAGELATPPPPPQESRS